MNVYMDEDPILVFESITALFNYSQENILRNDLDETGIRTVIVSVKNNEEYLLKFLKKATKDYNKTEWILLFEDNSKPYFPSENSFLYQTMNFTKGNQKSEIIKNTPYLKIELEKLSLLNSEYLKRSFFKDSIIGISLQNPQNTIVHYSKLNSILQETINHQNLYFDWETFPTDILRKHPCMTYRSYCDGCHIGKRRYPRVITIKNNLEVYPYRLTNEKFELGSLAGKSRLTNLILNGDYSNFYELNNKIYYEFVEKWPFSTFPLGGFYCAFDR